MDSHLLVRSGKEPLSHSMRKCRRGGCTESILPGGGEEVGVYRASVARFLGVTTSLVDRYASFEGVGNLDQYL